MPQVARPTQTFRGGHSLSYTLRSTHVPRDALPIVIDVLTAKGRSGGVTLGRVALTRRRR